MFPAFAHFRRTATHDTELAGQTIREGEKVVMWYVSSNRDETRYEDPDRFDVRRNPEHQAFGAGGRHFCLGAALARLELNIMFEETLSRYPADGDRRAPDGRRVGVRQPAQDAARPARPAAGAEARRPRSAPVGPRRAALGRLLVGADHVHDGVDQRQVGERLGEVAQVAAGLGSISSA